MEGGGGGGGWLQLPSFLMKSITLQLSPLRGIYWYPIHCGLYATTQQERALYHIGEIAFR